MNSVTTRVIRLRSVYSPHKISKYLQTKGLRTSSTTWLKYLQEEQKKQYEDDGYTIAKNLLSEEEVDEGRKALHQLIERGRSITDQEKVIYEFGEGHCYDEPRIHRVRFPSQQHQTFDHFMKHPKLLDCIEDLIGPSFRYIAQDKLNVKPAGHGAAIRWHQDWAFFPHTNDSVLTASVLLHDVTRENGCLQIIAGSHKGPVLTHLAENETRFANSVTDPNFKPTNIRYLEAPAGSVTFHHVRVVHGSARNVSDKPRSVLCYIYNAMDAWPLLGVGDERFLNIGRLDFDAFDRTRLRGERCVRPRLADVPVELPVPFVESSVFQAPSDIPEPEP
ncbi:probable alpha-ketoglutarate-dependent hypophosphite dioxygenase [Clytia hemisphaerica]|uniref:Phytanoyl-CoA dioxygenase n=1 Tax=Clytia hemisphaerica TaxID=252671 RepID=A0A7M5VFS6_9CNID|eukprot:TCONS_00046266-protein